MSALIQRGDTYLIDFDPPKGEEYKAGSETMKRRPAVVISRDAINKVRRTAIVLMSDEWQVGGAQAAKRVDSPLTKRRPPCMLFHPPRRLARLLLETSFWLR